MIKKNHEWINNTVEHGIIPKLPRLHSWSFVSAPTYLKHRLRPDLRINSRIILKGLSTDSVMEPENSIYDLSSKGACLAYGTFLI